MTPSWIPDTDPNPNITLTDLTLGKNTLTLTLIQAPSLFGPFSPNVPEVRVTVRNRVRDTLIMTVGRRSSLPFPLSPLTSRTPIPTQTTRLQLDLGRCRDIRKVHPRDICNVHPHGWFCDNCHQGCNPALAYPDPSLDHEMRPRP